MSPSITLHDAADLYEAGASMNTVAELLGWGSEDEAALAAARSLLRHYPEDSIAADDLREYIICNS